MGTRVVISLEGQIVDEVQLAKAVTVVGRHPECDVVIDHPAVSARHMLFRLVNRTVYVEDLASTNGTRVNGIATTQHVVHHLDLIEVGRHKLHFFDDALLSGHVDDLEHTVLNQYEQTMLAAHMPQAVRAPAPVAARGNDELDRTMAIPRPTAAAQFEAALQSAAPVAVAQEAAVAERPLEHPDGAARLALRALAGAEAGEVVALDRPNTMIGRVGRDTALVIRRGHSFFIARLAGHRPLRLNRVELGPGTHPIAERDVIDVGSSTFEVIVAT
jgi:FHA domain-containing protein